jgi:hypothetical protein
MFEKFQGKTLTATLAALMAAAGVGGVALAQTSGSAAPATTPAPAASQPSSSAPATADQPESAADKADSANDPADKADSANDPADTADGGTESASEVPGDDGPGGHADEATGNPNADTQAQGQQ